VGHYRANFEEIGNVIGETLCACARGRWEKHKDLIDSACHAARRIFGLLYQTDRWMGFNAAEMELRSAPALSYRMIWLQSM
jgi:hypothetical protein